MNYQPYREKILEIAMKAKEAGLVRLSAGNFSIRTEDGNLAITPTGIKYELLKPDDVAIINMDGELIDGCFKPSSESPLHLAIVRNMPQVQAVCHTHSSFAVTFAILGKEIPIVNMEMLICGAPIPVAPWARPGSPALGEGVIKLLQARPKLKGILMQNHGLVTIGKDLDQAFEFALNLEVGARAYHQACLIGEPIVLTEEQVEGLVNV